VTFFPNIFTQQNHQPFAEDIILDGLSLLANAYILLLEGITTAIKCNF